MTEIMEIQAENPKFHVLFIPGNPGFIILSFNEHISSTSLSFSSLVFFKFSSMDTDIGNDKLELAYATTDEKSNSVEARQESKASKIYAEQKEEEVKILEIYVEELELTVYILERRVYDMDEEVKRHRTTQDSLETELQALRQRLFRFEDPTGTMVTTTEGRDGYEGHVDTRYKKTHRQLNGLRFLGKVLQVQRDNKPSENKKSRQNEESEKDGQPYSFSTVSSNNDSKSGQVLAGEPIAPKHDINYPFPPHMQLLLPLEQTREICLWVM